MLKHHSRRRFSGKLAALAVGTALALSPTIATAAPATAPTLGTAPLATAAPAPNGPVAGFEDNAARAVYWLLEDVASNGWSLDTAIAVAGAGYGAAVRADVLDWVTEEGLAAAGTNNAYRGKLAQIIGIYGEDPATFIPGEDLEAQLRAAAENDPVNIYSTPFIIWGLAYTASGVPQTALDGLIAAQCENGMFGHGCDDLDTSGWVLQALLAGGLDPDSEPIAKALNGLAAFEIDGGYATNGSSNPNTNTTAIIAQVLRGAGQDAQADAALEYISNLQIGWVVTAAAPVGQIAFNQGQYDDIVAGNPAPGYSVALVMSQVPAAFGPNAFGSITATDSISDAPAIPLNFPTPYGATTDKDALLVAHWLENALVESDGLMPNYGARDWGITLDSLISLAALGTGTDAAQIALDRFASEGEQYVDFGPAQAAKSAYTLLVYGQDPRDFFAGRDLLAELNAGIGADGAISDDADAFGQSFALLTLARTAQGIPEESAQWLADQQCSDVADPNYGGYGIPWGEMSVCDVADADTTALAIQALGAAGLDEEAPAIAAGLDWLANNVNEAGAIEAWGDTSANSTSWAAQAFAYYGADQSAAARDFLRGQVITPDDVDASSVLRRADAGLIPASSGDTATAFAEGTDLILDSARFATAQAGLGLGGHGLADITALGASNAAPKPQFANTDDEKPEGEDSGSTQKPGGDSAEDAEGEAAMPQVHQPSYAG